MVTLNKPASDNTDWYQPLTQNWTALEKVTRYDVQATTRSVGDTTAETTIYSKVIAAGDMGADGLLRLLMELRYAQQVGGVDMMNLRVKFGGTVVAQYTTNIKTGSTNFNRAFLEVVIANQSVSQQRIEFHHERQDKYVADSSTAFAEPSGPDENERVINTSSIDTSADQTLEITTEWHTGPVRDPSVEMLYAVLDLVK